MTISEKEIQLTLNTPLSSVQRLSKEQALGLKKLSLVTISDILFYFPFRYADESEHISLTNLEKGKPITIYGVLQKVTIRRSFHGHIPMTEAKINDGSGTLRLIWFNQAYIGKMYPEGATVKVTGTVQEDSKGFFLSNPLIEHAKTIEEPSDSLFKETKTAEFLIPVYKETKGVTSLFLYHLIKKIIHTASEIEDPIPPFVRESLSLPSLKESLLYIHFPKEKKLTIAARKRFAFQEIFIMKLRAEKERKLLRDIPSYAVDTSFIKEFMSLSSFTPTNAQKKSIEIMSAELKSGTTMNRLLEGDVGSGKTFVAAALMYATSHTHDEETKMPLQVAYMAPTEILARQHFESICTFFKHTKLSIALLTGSGCSVFPSKTNKDVPAHISKTQLKKWLDEGKVSIVIGTHALVQKTVTFKHLSLVIVDEQHRFGVRQRKLLLEKRKENSSQKLPHLLSMSATPIPRTLALTLFGDLDLVVLDEMPKGRKAIITKIISSKEKDATYKEMAKELAKGHQAYVICPRIEKNEDPGSLPLRSVEEETLHLGEDVFKEWIVDSLHGKMKPEEKETVMRDFLEKKSHVLVATSVVEVGVNIQNATAILIEGAERFGLAQLHQLRGRVGRGDAQSYCFLSTTKESESSAKRLQSLVKAKNGFELAEFDMQERGIGTLAIGKQWGVSDIAMEALRNPKLVELAGLHAKQLVKEDAGLIKYPALAQKIEESEKVHME